MIQLTRLNNQPLVVNADLIKFIERAPDTVITLLTGDKIVVRESVEDVLHLVADFHERFYRRVAPTIVFDTSATPPSASAASPGAAGAANT
jgi:flagellar protein FlbD